MSILRDIHRNVTVILLDAHEHIVHGLRVDLAAPRILRGVGVHVGLEPALDNIAFGALLACAHIVGVVVGLTGFVGLYQSACIAVLAQEVHRIVLDDLKVFVLDEGEVDATFQ